MNLRDKIKNAETFVGSDKSWKIKFGKNWKAKKAEYLLNGKTFKDKF